MMQVRYYDNGARFQPGNFVTFSDILYMRMLRARDDWDVWSILVTGRPLPPAGGLGPRLTTPEHAELRRRYVERFPELARFFKEPWVEAKHKCAWCGLQMLVRLSDRKQRCPNDCASGLGKCPEQFLPDPPKEPST